MVRDMPCIFSGETTDSDEHVVPLWLQKRFNLQNETVYVPNGTTLKYKHLKVPAAAAHNRKFGEIENHIAQGKLDPVEVFLWAFKLHVGFLYRDSNLRIDIKDPASPAMLDIAKYADQMWLFRKLYALWANGGRTHPSPIGTVFVVDTILPTPAFDFFHCLITGTVGISIGGKFILAFLWDQGDGAHANILEQWNTWHAPRLRSLEGSAEYAASCYMAPHVWACESAYWLYRNRRSFNYLMTEDMLSLAPPLFRVPGRPAEEEEFRLISRNFGLELTSFGGETGHMYTMRELPQPVNG